MKIMYASRKELNQETILF